MYFVTKHYPHSLGLSAAFRQWKASHSHCRFIHGYALAFTFEFEAKTLDDRNWVLDFGALKTLKQFLVDTFDHKLCVAKDDPQIQMYIDMNDLGIADIKIMDAVGCESFAKLAYVAGLAAIDQHARTGVTLTKVLCHEHEGNAAGYGPR